MSSPFSYLYFTFTSNDSSVSHSVQLYSDISGGKWLIYDGSQSNDEYSAWISGDSSKEMTWDAHNDSGLIVLKATLTSPGPFQITDSVCQDGTLYYAMQYVRRSLLEN